MMLKSTSEEMLNLDFLRFYASAAIVWHHSHEFLIPEAQRATAGRERRDLRSLSTCSS